MIEITGRHESSYFECHLLPGLHFCASRTSWLAVTRLRTTQCRQATCTQANCPFYQCNVITCMCAWLVSALNTTHCLSCSAPLPAHAQTDLWSEMKQPKSNKLHDNHDHSDNYFACSARASTAQRGHTHASLKAAADQLPCRLSCQKPAKRQYRCYTAGVLRSVASVAHLWHPNRICAAPVPHLWHLCCRAAQLNTVEVLIAQVTLRQHCKNCKLPAP